MRSSVGLEVIGGGGGKRERSGGWGGGGGRGKRGVTLDSDRGKRRLLNSG